MTANPSPYIVVPKTLPLVWGVAVDFALTQKQENDATAVQPFAMDWEGNLYLDEPDHFRLESHDAVERALNACEKCATRNNGGVMLAMERGVIDRAIKPQLDRRILDRDLAVTVMRLSVPGDKQAKARVLQARMQQGRVFFKRCAFFEDTWLPEFLGFGGGGKHDDLVDAAAMAAYMIQEGLMAAPPESNATEDEIEDDYEAMMRRVKDPREVRSHVPCHINGQDRERKPRVFR
jgi:predicted phage terminase large subunit-like protein